MEFIASLVAQIAAENLFARIGRHLGYLFNYRSNILDVTRQIDKLRDERVRIQQCVDEANRRGDEVFPDVQRWLSGAEEMVKETDKFIADERDANRSFFNLKQRYQQGKKAKNQEADIVNEMQAADNLIRRGVAQRPSEVERLFRLALGCYCSYIISEGLTKIGLAKLKMLGRSYF